MYFLQSFINILERKFSSDPSYKSGNKSGSKWPPSKYVNYEFRKNPGKYLDISVHEKLIAKTIFFYFSNAIDKVLQTLHGSCLVFIFNLFDRQMNYQFIVSNNG